MNLLLVHPTTLFYSKVFLSLEPLGLELVAAAARIAGHAVRLVDLQVESAAEYMDVINKWRPDVIAISCSYLANVPEVVKLSHTAKEIHPDCFVLVGGHSASFIPEALLEHAHGAIDCVLAGEGEATIADLLHAVQHDRRAIEHVPGAATRDGRGPSPPYVRSIDDLSPARDLLQKRRRYFIGILDPCASVEFSRGCPWDCSFCSAWTFYGRKYRLKSPHKAIEDLQNIAEPGIFIVDDVAFAKYGHGIQIGEKILSKGIKKQFYLETRGDVLVRNFDVFKLWKEAGLTYMFVGLEAIDDEDLDTYRKRTSMAANAEALEAARALGVSVSVNIIADPDWDEAKFKTVRRWCRENPERVSISVNTPYPGTENWIAKSPKLTTRDYRLFDIQHAVLPTRLSLGRFYEELVKTQQIVGQKFLGWRGLVRLGKILGANLMRGQVNGLKMIWRFNQVFNPELQLADHEQAVEYEIPLPSNPEDAKRENLFILK